MTSEQKTSYSTDQPIGCESVSRKNAASEPHSGFFADYHNVRTNTAALRDVDGLKPGDEAKWGSIAATPERHNQLTAERLNSLQTAENRLAGLQGRTPERVRGINMESNQYGFYVSQDVRDPHTNRVVYPRGIYVNTNPAVFDNRAESVNTVVHEGRHAYQQHAVDRPDFHPQIDDPKAVNAAGHQDVNRWTENDPRNGGYMTVKKDGENAYMRQPVERDAGEFGFAVTQGLYPDYRPSPDRIDQYNAQNAQSKYGKLETSKESQRLTPSDPAAFRTKYPDRVRGQTASAKEVAAKPTQADLQRQLNNLWQANQPSNPRPGGGGSPSNNNSAGHRRGDSAGGTTTSPPKESPLLKAQLEQMETRNRLLEVRHEKDRLLKESEKLQVESKAMKAEKTSIESRSNTSVADHARLGDMHNRKLEIDYRQKEIDGRLQKLQAEEKGLQNRYQAAAQREKAIAAGIEQKNAQVRNTAESVKNKQAEKTDGPKNAVKETKQGINAKDQPKVEKVPSRHNAEERDKGNRQVDNHTHKQTQSQKAGSPKVQNQTSDRKIGNQKAVGASQAQPNGEKARTQNRINSQRINNQSPATGRKR